MLHTGQVLKNLVGGVALLLALIRPGLAGAATSDLQVIPNEIEIGAFFQGAQVTVQGEIHPGSQAVLEVIGQPLEEKLMRKGRRGFLWMNVGEIQIMGAPCLYLVKSTNPSLLYPSQNHEAPWGYQALEKQVTFSGQLRQGEEGALFKQFLELKESEGLYSNSPRPLKAITSDPDQSTVEGSFNIPAKVTPGNYSLRLSVIQNGQVVSQKFADFKVMKIGFPALLSSLAYQHGALYGILAVVIALVAGFLMGFLFKGKGGAH